VNSPEPAITLLQLRNLTLKLGRSATPSTIALLCGTVWGTPGGMRYQHLDTADKIQALHDPWFLYMEKEGETIGVLCMDRRMVGDVPTFYIRYFSFAESMRRKVSTDAGDGSPASRGQGLFKRFASEFFADPAALLAAAGMSKAVFYAFVEVENARSKDMVAQMGLSLCGRFSTLIFSRIFLRQRPQVRRATSGEHAHLRAQVRTAFSDHAFFVEHGLFYQGDYFVLEEQGQIVAGCQAHQVHWRVVDIPGLAGKAIMRILPWLPLVSRLFNPQKFDFSAIEGLFCLPGHEDRLQTLLEGVLAQQKMHVALLWLDPQAPLHATLRRQVRLGLMQHFKRDVPVAVAMRSYGMEEDELAALRDRPLYVSAFDAT
jgi:hypothetical protein